MTPLPVYTEPYRPQFHFSPPQWWMNDPNGLVYYEGEYHFFYQHNPGATVWGPMHWGHALSTDLVHWQHLPIAMYPDEIGTIFSGTAVVDANNTSGLVPGGGLVAIYSYDNQSLGAAYSVDRGRTWHKYGGNPIIPAMAKDFRDPKIMWYAPLQRWVMALAVGQIVKFYTSPDLLHWDHASDFTGGYIGGTWEMPDLFPLTVAGQVRWILILGVSSTAPAGGSGTRYFIGGFDGKTFVDAYPDKTLWLDYGPDNYAGTTWNNLPANQRIFIGWMNNWLYANEIPTSTWRGSTTVPRELSLLQTADGLRLAQTPVAALKELRQPINTWNDLIIENSVVLNGLHGKQLEIIAEFELGTAEIFGFEFFAGAASVQITYNTRLSQLTVNRPQADVKALPTTFSAPLPAHGSRIQLHLYVDHSTIEIFADGGLLSVSTLAFPQPDDDAVNLFTKGGSVHLLSLEAYSLASIW
ncbi:MAG: glycoside hydrolase family 32 protein [Anaerolineae bacterium]